MLCIGEFRFMAHFKSYEQEKIIDRVSGDVVILNDEHRFEKKRMLIVTPRCLVFDQNWDAIETACEYLDNRLNVKRQEWNSIEAKGRAIKLFHDFLEEYDLKLEETSVSIINNFIAWLFRGDETEKYILGKKTERTGKTVNTYLSHIRDYFKYLRHTHKYNDPFFEEYEEINRPASKPKGFFEHTLKTGKVGKSMFKVKERGKKEITILGQSEVQKLIDASSLMRDKLMILLMIFTGMRIGEVLNLKVQAIGVPDETAKVQQLRMIPSSTDDKRRKLKTGTRDVFLPPWVMKLLDNHYERTWLPLVDAKGLNHNYFFISEGHRNTGMPLSYNGVKSRFETLFDATGIDANPHDFRHTWATNLARLKTDPETLRKMLGHKNVSSVGIYIQAAKVEEISESLAEFYGSYDIGLEINA